jgi:hypothetical protein
MLDGDFPALALLEEVQMRNLTKRDVDEAWEEWVAMELATSDCASPDDALTPTTAARMLAHLRFSSAFCDYVLQNEPARIVECHAARRLAGRERAAE